ncbi:Mediator of RNA polymerase II transcription subunit 6 [Coemansia sp. RSA 2337]|nr:Mediator of RNA polymerase II transcription subunit 6 [Coemansia sp. S3946]KAJ2050981.1 Mediator of RNA polymerase II transcription subunit 6 [Coemansia sp. S16]KAJ2075056.1 Mediator of RNA polymerase II transcription subunit 6 [Coemansia sp. S155-1]KAJ2111950.1 Mediator of RNA polymerase II transcription subunit 6 [Coemansia sp. RSA 922]KAJ2332172.1 Mediator of RNA polymerase II transcription subunit 6 [Coemansia sp. RSA 2673]KAJ2468559.1 Mediator of RNA polymerase II transcription subunit
MSKELTAIEWRSDQWLFQFGGLRPDNVLEYFSQSPFWDPSSNNAVLKMQTQFNDLQHSSYDLKSMVGIEFAVTHQEPPALFIITKFRRSSPTKLVPITVYYITDGNAYEAPTLYSIVSTRMLSSIKKVEEAFDIARSHAEFHPSTGYSWKETAEQKSTRNAALKDLHQQI